MNLDGIKEPYMDTFKSHKGRPIEVVRIQDGHLRIVDGDYVNDSITFHRDEVPRLIEWLKQYSSPPPGKTPGQVCYEAWAPIRVKPPKRWWKWESLGDDERVAWEAAAQAVQSDLKEKAEAFDWVLRKIRTVWSGYKPPDDGRSDIQDVYGSMHILCSHAHGYEAYIVAHKCDDKQGEIARLTVELATLREKLAGANARADEAELARDIHASNAKVYQEQATLAQQQVERLVRAITEGLPDDHMASWCSILDFLKVLQVHPSHGGWAKAMLPRLEDAIAPTTAELDETAQQENPMTGIELIAAERKRQIEVEGWTPEHDDKHIDGELRQAAAMYAYPIFDKENAPPMFWPWDASWWKPCSEIRDLAKAGALIAAEIDRLQRLLDAAALDVPDVGERAASIGAVDAAPAEGGKDVQDEIDTRIVNNPAGL